MSRVGSKSEGAMPCRIVHILLLMVNTSIGGEQP